MYKHQLTQIALKSLVRRPGRHSDSGGLYFRVLPGTKMLLGLSLPGERRGRESSLGAFPELGLAEARIKHAELRKMVRVDRVDPIAQKRAAKIMQPSTKPNFGAMADEYLRTHADGWRNDKHRYQWAMSLGQYCAPLRDLPVDEIKTADILAVLKPLWARAPETASRLRGRIETILAAAQALGHVPEDRANCARWKGHLDHLLPKRQRLTRGHHRALAYSDLPAFWVKLAETPGTAARALMFTILCCARTSETINATWDEVSFADAVWRVPASRMKMSVEHHVPLSAQALSILGDQQAARGKGAFVFPGGRPRTPLSTMAMSMLLRRLGVDATTHGMRSAARSWMTDQGVAFELAEATLAHVVGNSVVQAYQRSSMLERRRPLMQSWSDFVTGANDNVVALKGRARAPIRRA